MADSGDDFRTDTDESKSSRISIPSLRMSTRSKLYSLLLRGLSPFLTGLRGAPQVLSRLWSKVRRIEKPPRVSGTVRWSDGRRGSGRVLESEDTRSLVARQPGVPDGCYGSTETLYPTELETNHTSTCGTTTGGGERLCYGLP